MSDDWDIYLLRVDDAPASVFVDLGLHETAPVDGFLWLGYVRVSMRQPRSDGLSSGEEFNALSALEDDICKRITMTGDIIYVGRNTSAGNRDFFFYTDDEDQFLKAANAAMRRFPEYQFEAGTKPDEEWTTYFRFLYPSPRNMQLIFNRRLCDTLEKNGDKLAVPRDIDHRVYFNDGRAARRYGEWLQSQGFTVNVLDRLDDEAQFYVDFVRRDYPDKMDTISLDLFDKAAELGGDYDGWGCSVQKDESEA